LNYTHTQNVLSSKQAKHNIDRICDVVRYHRK